MSILTARELGIDGYFNIHGHNDAVLSKMSRNKEISDTLYKMQLSYQTKLHLLRLVGNSTTKEDSRKSVFA